MAQQKKTLVLGASDNPSRYSYVALQRLRQLGHPVVAIGRKTAQVGDVAIGKEKVEENGIDTVTLYMNPLHQEEYLEYILSLNPDRIIFNPGTENPKLAAMAREKGIKAVHGCTLVMLSTNQY